MSCIWLCITRALILVRDIFVSVLQLICPARCYWLLLIRLSASLAFSGASMTDKPLVGTSETATSVDELSAADVALATSCPLLMTKLPPNFDTHKDLSALASLMDSDDENDHDDDGDDHTANTATSTTTKDNDIVSVDEQHDGVDGKTPVSTTKSNTSSTATTTLTSTSTSTSTTTTSLVSLDNANNSSVHRSSVGRHRSVIASPYARVNTKADRLKHATNEPNLPPSNDKASLSTITPTSSNKPKRSAPRGMVESVGSASLFLDMWKI
jgi:hypothetical protein